MVAVTFRGWSPCTRSWWARSLVWIFDRPFIICRIPMLIITLAVSSLLDYLNTGCVEYRVIVPARSGPARTIPFRWLRHPTTGSGDCGNRPSDDSHRLGHAIFIILNAILPSARVPNEDER